MDNLLDAKYNKYLDSAWVRLALLAVVFTGWLAAGIGILKAV